MCDWSEIWSHMVSIYEDQSGQHDSYKKMYDKLCIVEGVSNPMRIVLTRVVEDDGDIWTDVSGCNGTTFRNSENHAWMCANMTDSKLDAEVSYALEFTDWQLWLAMELDSQTLIDFTLPEIAAHCLWEISYVSFDEDEIDITKGYLNKIVDAINKNATDDV